MVVHMPVSIQELEDASTDRFSVMLSLYQMWTALKDMELTEEKVDGYTETEQSLREQFPSLADVPVDEWFDAHHYYLLTDLARVPIAGEFMGLGPNARDPYASIASIVWIPGGTPIVRLMMSGFFMGSTSEQARWERYSKVFESNGWVESDMEYGLPSESKEIDWDAFLHRLGEE